MRVCKRNGDILSSYLEIPFSPDLDMSAVNPWSKIVFSYTGAPQAFTLYPGLYAVECFGGSGGGAVGRYQGTYTVNNNAGAGGRAFGLLNVTYPLSLLAYVGDAGGTRAAMEFTGTSPGGWNGGGSGGCKTDPNSSFANGTSGGGGATDIRLVGGAWNLAAGLRSRIIVAGGGGGVCYWGTGGKGGGLAGDAGAYSGAVSPVPTGGTQISGFAFGQGGSGNSSVGAGAGAGGGYYGGLAVTNAKSYVEGSGGGGSGFISGHTGCNAVSEAGTHTGQAVHYSGLKFQNTEFTNGARIGSGLINIYVRERAA